MNAYYMAGSGAENPHATKGNWLFMGFKGFDGNSVGSQIMVHPDSKRKEAAWYATNQNDWPFYYFGPAYLFHKSKELLKGEKLVLNYRINHIAGEVSKADLEHNFTAYKNIQNQ